MNSVLRWAGIGLGGCLAMYFLYAHLQYFGDITFLGGILLLELIIACLWKYDQRFSCWWCLRLLARAPVCLCRAVG